MVKLVIYPPVDRQRLERIQSVGGVRVVNAADEDEAVREIADADAMFGRITPRMLAAARQLRWVQSPTASLEHYLFPELIEHPCTLTNMRGLFSDVIADHTFAYMLCFARNLHRYIRQQINSRWSAVGGEEHRPSFAVGAGVATPIDRAHLHLAGLTLGLSARAGSAARWRGAGGRFRCAWWRLIRCSDRCPTRPVRCGRRRSCPRCWPPAILW